MKRRTNSARSQRPARPALPPGSLLSRFPGLNRMNDLDGFRALYTLSCQSRGDILIDAALEEFLGSRGLQFGATGEEFMGCEVWALSTIAGEVLGTFSVEFAV